MVDPYAELLHRITMDSNVLGGKPIIRGTRVSVQNVLDHLAEEMNFDVMFEIFPHITMQDVRACIKYGAEVVTEAHEERLRQLATASAR